MILKSPKTKFFQTYYFCVSFEFFNVLDGRSYVNIHIFPRIKFKDSNHTFEKILFKTMSCMNYDTNWELLCQNIISLRKLCDTSTFSRNVFRSALWSDNTDNLQNDLSFIKKSIEYWISRIRLPCYDISVSWFLIVTITVRRLPSKK